MSEHIFTDSPHGKSDSQGSTKFPMTFVLPAGGAKSVGFGVYDAGVPQPQFDIRFTPEGVEEAITASLDRLDIPGKPRYLLLYLVHNFGNKSCRVVVRQRDDGAKQ